MNHEPVMDYGTIDNITSASTNNSDEPVEDNYDISITKTVIKDFHIITCTLIYLSYLHDNEGFTFLIRCFTQGLIYSIPDIEDLLPEFILLTTEEQELKLSRLSAVLSIVVPYSIINFLFSIVMHYNWLSQIAFNPSDIIEYIDNDSNLKIFNMKWNYNSIFVDLFGESVINQSHESNANCLYLIFLDLVIISLQLGAVHKIRLLWSTRLVRSGY